MVYTEKQEVYLYAIGTNAKVVEERLHYLMDVA